MRDGLAGIYLPSEVVNHDINATAIRAIGLDPQESLQIDGGDGTVLASGDVFVTDPVVKARLAERAHLVDMEAYGVVFACRQFGVPVRLVKHVSDSADETAMDWPALSTPAPRCSGSGSAPNSPDLCLGLTLTLGAGFSVGDEEAGCISATWRPRPE